GKREAGSEGVGNRESGIAAARESGARDGEGSPRGGRGLAELYPGVAAFAVDDVPALQVRLARLEKEREMLAREVRERSLASRMLRLGRALAGWRR
ncbi:MAG TPA: hypothetical protein VFS05_11825, partial [Gemmatimonadaceae bacterium]|nr:hypothetical protein [Gemmatimonadaceae bacterium]